MLVYQSQPEAPPFNATKKWLTEMNEIIINLPSCKNEGKGGACQVRYKSRWVIRSKAA